MKKASTSQRQAKPHPNIVVRELSRRERWDGKSIIARLVYYRGGLFIDWRAYDLLGESGEVPTTRGIRVPVDAARELASAILEIDGDRELASAVERYGVQGELVEAAS